MKILKSIYRLFILIVIMLLAGIVFGFFSFVHPLFDSFSHFRIHFMVIFMILLGILLPISSLKVRYMIMATIVCFVAYLWDIAYQSSPKVPLISCQKTLKMMQFNLRFDNTHLDQLGAYLQKESIDIATFQEVTYRHKATIEALKEHYPYQAYCEFATVGGEMIISKYPFTHQGHCLEKEGLLWQEIDAHQKIFTLVSLHLHWPYPFSQAEQIKLFSQELEQIHTPIIVAGDFNAAPWSFAVEQLAKASHSSVIEGVRWSIKLNTPMIPTWLPIDHILISKFDTQKIYVGEDLGSDHRPIVATLCYD